jgi:hypothetical protein
MGLSDSRQDAKSISLNTHYAYYKNKYKINITDYVNNQSKKYRITCLMCNEEIGYLSNTDFAENHIVTNPGHLEYRVVVEMPTS